jgi:hypothetical protein
MSTDTIEHHDVTLGSSNPTEHQEISHHRHLFAVAWIAIAWIVGSLVFEVNAGGAEPFVGGSPASAPSFFQDVIADAEPAAVKVQEFTLKQPCSQTLSVD